MFVITKSFRSCCVDMPIVVVFKELPSLDPVVAKAKIVKLTNHKFFRPEIERWLKDPIFNFEPNTHPNLQWSPPTTFGWFFGQQAPIKVTSSYTQDPTFDCWLWLFCIDYLDRDCLASQSTSPDIGRLSSGIFHRSRNCCLEVLVIIFLVKFCFVLK